MPDQVSLHLTTQLGTTGQNLALSEVLLKDKVYIQNLKGKWYVIDKSKLTGGTNSLGTGNDASTAAPTLKDFIAMMYQFSRHWKRCIYREQAAQHRPEREVDR